MNWVWRTLQILWLFVLLAGAGFVLQTDFAAHISILGVQPDLMLAAVVLLARSKGPTLGCLIGFTVGLMQDGLVPEHVGMNAGLMTALGFALGHLRESILVETPAASGVILFGAGLLHALSRTLLVSWGNWPSIAAHFATVGIPGALYTAILVPLLMWAVPRILRGRD